MLLAVLCLLWAQGVQLPIAEEYERAGKYLEAANAYRQMLEQDPARISLLLHLGHCEYQLGRYEEAEQIFRQVLERDERSAAGALGLGRALIATGRPEEAVVHLQDAVRLNPTDIDTRRVFAHGMIEAGHFYEAELLLNDLLKGDPKDGASWFHLGRLLLKQGFYETALRAFDKSAVLRPQPADAQRYRAVCLVQLARYREAVVLYEEIESDIVTSRDLDFLLGYVQLLYEMGDLEQALKSATAVQLTLRKNSMVYLWRARILYRLGRLDEAAKDAESAVKLASDLPFARSLLVRVYRKQGRIEDAARQATWLQEYDHNKAKRETR